MTGEVSVVTTAPIPLPTMCESTKLTHGFKIEKFSKVTIWGKLQLPGTFWETPESWVRGTSGWCRGQKSDPHLQEAADLRPGEEEAVLCPQ